MNDSLTLWQIDDALHSLLLMREEDGVTDEERAAIDGQIQVWCDAQLAKVDGIVGYLKHAKLMQQAAKEEADLLREKAGAWESRARRLKEIVMNIMEMRGKKRIEGNTGVLRIQASGGKRALKITRPDLVPPTYKTFTYTFTHAQLVWLCKHVHIPGEVKGPEIEVDTEAVRKALESNCSRCDGAGKVPSEQPWVDEADMITCSACDGTGHQLVPGAELEPRGEHLRWE